MAELRTTVLLNRLVLSVRFGGGKACTRVRKRESPDARAVQELSYSDPAFCLSYLAHSQLFVNNLARNGSAAQARLHVGPRT